MILGVETFQECKISESLLIHDGTSGFTTYFMGEGRISSLLQKDTFTELKLTSCAIYETIDEEKVSGRVVRTDQNLVVLSKVCCSRSPQTSGQ